MNDPKCNDTAAMSGVDSSDLLAELEHWQKRAHAAEKLCIEAHECFDAAEFEGIIEAIDDGNMGRIKDIWTRRLTNIRCELSRFHDDYEEHSIDEDEDDFFC